MFYRNCVCFCRTDISSLTSADAEKLEEEKVAGQNQHAMPEQDTAKYGNSKFLYLELCNDKPNFILVTKIEH